MRRVEGEQFVTGFGNPAQFVVLEPGRARPLLGAVGQVAGAVVAVAAFDGGLGLDCYGINISDDLEKGLRSSEKQKPRAYRTHPTSGLEVSCGLRLAVRSRSNILCLLSAIRWSKVSLVNDQGQQL